MRRKPLLIVVSIAAMFMLALAIVTGSPALASGTSSSLGTTTVGNSGGGFMANLKRVNRSTVSTDGSVSKLSIYLAPTSTSGQQTLKGVIYSDSSGAPQRLLATSNELIFQSTNAAGWYDLTFASPTNLAAGNYWFGVMTGAGAGVAGFRYADVAGSRTYNPNTYTSGASSTFGTQNEDGEQMSLYATFTPTPPTTTTTTTATTTPTTTTTTTGTTTTATTTPTTTTTTTATTTTSSSANTDRLWSGGPAGTAIDTSQWSLVSAVSGHVKVVDDPLGSGKRVYQYAVPDSDQPYSGSQPRADMLSKYLMQNGGTYYISMSVLIPAGQIPPINSGWVQVFQTKNTDASMWTNALHIHPASGSATQNSFAFTGNGSGNHPPDWYSPSPVDAKWHNLTVKVLMSTSANGTIDIWWDGVKQTFRNGSGTLTNLVTMNSPSSDWMGNGWPLDIDFYRSQGAITGFTPVIYHDFPKIGKTFASVAPAIVNGPAGS